MVTPTKVRTGRATALLAGLQSAKGTPVSNFTAAAGVGRLWTNRALTDVGPRKSDPAGWMMKPQLETDGRYSSSRALADRLVCKATPKSLEILLRSNWGGLSAGSFTLANQVNEWLSLGWVENITAGATEYFHRIHDAWIHRLKLRATMAGSALLEAEYAAERDTAPTALNALVGITLPVAPIAVDDKNVFAGRQVRLFRDPTGANQELDLHWVEVTLDQNLGTIWSMMDAATAVFKKGFPGPRVTIALRAHVANETWTLLSNARGGTKQRFRLTASAVSPAKTLQIDFYEVDFEVQALGHEGQRYVEFAGVGQAHLDGSGNFVSISLT